MWCMNVVHGSVSALVGLFVNAGVNIMSCVCEGHMFMQDGALLYSCALTGS